MALTKEQRAAYNKAWRERNPNYSREWSKLNRNSRKNKQFKWRYNITLEEYNKMFISQEGKCQICGRHQSDLKRSLSVDHCHVSNKVRGLLCDLCNKGIGCLKDNPDIIRLAASYVERHKNVK